MMTQRYAQLSPERLGPVRSDTGSGTSVVGGLGFSKGGDQTVEQHWCREGESNPHGLAPTRF